ncbi:hypothetical protein BJ912DRAFT_1065063 [Pholiota molesta]|nr:hypothetical protein BJ912DRAFT_1065063 [Pholiota molesta]
MKQILESIEARTKGNHSPPIDILPIELLIHIFTLVCHQPSRHCRKSLDVEIDPNSPSFSAPLFLGKICGSWRDIAWSTPSLWTYIDLVLPIANHYLHAQLLEEWLSRSEDLPLTITFRRDESTRAGNITVWGEQTLPLFHLISNEWQRWEYINLFIPHGFCAVRMGDFNSKEMPCLRMAKLRGLQYPPGPNFLSNATNLRELCFRGAQFPPLTRPYLQLTRLIVTGLCLNDVMHIIAHAPSLTALHIMDGSVPFIAVSDQQQKLSLECLTSLTVIRSVLISPFLDTLNLPRLRHLCLEGNPNKPLKLDLLRTFFRCNGRSLQSLVLAGFSEGRIAELTEHTPSLRKLTLHRDGIQSAWFFQFNLAYHALDFLPELDYLEFHGIVAPFYDILDTLKRRWWSGTVQTNSDDTPVSTNGVKSGYLSKVQTVIFSSLTKECQTDTRNYLKSELEDGMDLRFKCWTPTPTED